MLASDPSFPSRWLPLRCLQSAQTPSIEAMPNVWATETAAPDSSSSLPLAAQSCDTCGFARNRRHSERISCAPKPSLPEPAPRPRASSWQSFHVRLRRRTPREKSTCTAHSRLTRKTPDRSRPTDENSTPVQQRSPASQLSPRSHELLVPENTKAKPLSAGTLPPRCAPKIRPDE